jgi:hypothetical protein
MTTDALQRNIAFFRAQLESWPLPDLVPRLARLLAGGEPVTVQQVATAGGWTQEQVQAALARHPRVDFDAHGRIAGFGLTLQPSRFLRGADEVPPPAVAYVADQVKVAAEMFADYPWSGRSVKYHREQIRTAFGFREFTLADEDKLAGWLADEVCPVELRDEQSSAGAVDSVSRGADRAAEPGSSESSAPRVPPSRSGSATARCRG